MKSNFIFLPSICVLFVSTFLLAGQSFSQSYNQNNDKIMREQCIKEFLRLREKFDYLNGITPPEALPWHDPIINNTDMDYFRMDTEMCMRANQEIRRCIGVLHGFLQKQEIEREKMRRDEAIARERMRHDETIERERMRQREDFEVFQEESRCSPSQIEKMLEAGFTKEEILELCNQY